MKNFEIIKIKNPKVTDNLIQLLYKKLINFDVDQNILHIEKRYGRKFSAQQILEILLEQDFVFLATDGEDIFGYADLKEDKNTGELKGGYFVFPNNLRAGIGTELLLILIKTSQDESKILRVEVEETNIPSIMLVQKVSELIKPTIIKTNTTYNPPTKIFYWNPTFKV